MVNLTEHLSGGRQFVGVREVGGHVDLVVEPVVPILERGDHGKDRPPVLVGLRAPGRERSAIVNPINGEGDRCVEVARGEFFRWQSADDLSAPTFVQRCVEVLDAHPDVIQAYPRCTLIDECGAELEQYAEKIQALADSPRERYLHVMQHLALVNALYGVMRTDALRRTAVHGAYLGADLVVQAEIALYGKLWEIPEYLFLRRMHAQAHSAMTPEQKQAFYNPAAGRRSTLTRWRHLGERLRSVARSPLSRWEKMRLGATLLRSALASRDELAREMQTAALDRWRRGPRA